jgi:hypothetical protein
MAIGDQSVNKGEPCRSTADRSSNLSAACAAIPVQDLCVVRTVHQDNCRQPGCQVLAALEARIVALGASGVFLEKKRRS